MLSIAVPVFSGSGRVGSGRVVLGFRGLAYFLVHKNASQHRVGWGGVARIEEDDGLLLAFPFEGKSHV